MIDLGEDFEHLPVLSGITNYFRRHSGNYCIAGNISSHNRTSANHSGLANSNAPKNGGITAYGYLIFYYGPHELPIFFSLQLPVFANSPWVLVVDKHHAVSNEYPATYFNALTDEGMARYLAPSAYGGALLYLDKSTNPTFCFHDTPVKIDKIRMKNLYALAKDHIFCDHNVFLLALFPTYQY